MVPRVRAAETFRYVLLTDVLLNPRFVYQVVIPKKLADSKYVKIFEGGEAKVLPAWDPMGTLA